MRPRASFDIQRTNVVQLLRDRGNDLVSGPAIKDWEEMGAHQGDRFVLTKEYVRRAFGVPQDPDAPDAIYTEGYVEHLRGATHVLAEKRLEELKADCRNLWRAVVRVFPRDEGGDRDYEALHKLLAELRAVYERVEHKRRAYEKRGEPVDHEEAVAAVAEDLAPLDPDLAEGWRKKIPHCLRTYPELKRDLWLCDRGIDVLALYCLDDDLFVEFARARSVREETRMEDRNASIAADYEDQKAGGKKEKDAAYDVAMRNGISVTRVRQIAEIRRMEAGEPKRGRGRPPKKEPGERAG